MRAAILGLEIRFEVQPEDSRPPAHIALSLRPCWRKPPVRLDLEFVYEREDTAYYAPREKTTAALL